MRAWTAIQLTPRPHRAVTPWSEVEVGNRSELHSARLHALTRAATSQQESQVAAAVTPWSEVEVGNRSELRSARLHALTRAATSQQESQVAAAVMLWSEVEVGNRRNCQRHGLLRTFSESLPAGVSAGIDNNASCTYDGVGKLRFMVGANQNGA